MDTVPPHKYGGLVWSPYGSLGPASTDDLQKMRFDKQHFTRAYTLCRGRGFAAEECYGKLPPDMHVTPQNQLSNVFKKEVSISAMQI